MLKPQRLKRGDKIAIVSLSRGLLGMPFCKPIDEKYYEEYKEIYKIIFKDMNTPVLYNVNFGHSVPRCVIPYDAITTVDFDNKKIIIEENIVE